MEADTPPELKGLMVLLEHCLTFWTLNYTALPDQLNFFLGVGGDVFIQARKRGTDAGGRLTVTLCYIIGIIQIKTVHPDWSLLITV